MSNSKLSDEIDTILSLHKAGMTRKEIGELLGKRHKRESAYSESGIRYALHRGLAERCKELYGGDDEPNN